MSKRPEQTDLELHREWLRRPDDERYLSLADLTTAVCEREARSRTATAPAASWSRLLGVPQTQGTDGATVAEPAIAMTTKEGPLPLSHWTFGQLCSAAGAPAGYLRRIPPDLALLNMQHGLATNAKPLKVYHDSRNIRAATSPTYGRITDAQVCRTLQGCVDTSVWRVPGCFGTDGVYRPAEQVTKESTTLYAGDRDMFLFLIADGPADIIDVALPGEPPDPLYRGVMLWNSEVGARTIGITSFLLRGVCQNRILWGIREKLTMDFRHTRLAPDRFLSQGWSAIQHNKAADLNTPYQRIRAAQHAPLVIGHGPQYTADEFIDWAATNTDLTRSESKSVWSQAVNDYHRPPQTRWELSNAVTAYARTVGHQDARTNLETVGVDLLWR